MKFTPDEVVVLRQLMRHWTLVNGRTVAEEIQQIEAAPYVVGFKPAEGETRLRKSDWDDFVRKLKAVARGDA